MWRTEATKIFNGVTDNKHNKRTEIQMLFETNDTWAVNKKRNTTTVMDTFTHRQNGRCWCSITPKYFINDYVTYINVFITIALRICIFRTVMYELQMIFLIYYQHVPTIKIISSFNTSITRCLMRSCERAYFINKYYRE